MSLAAQLPPGMQIAWLENDKSEVALEIQRVLLAASAQEAALLGIVNQPLRAGLHEIRAPGLRYLGARHPAGALCGWVSLDANASGPAEVGIVSLVVDPGRQRLGIATALLHAALQAMAPAALRVSTPALNGPALELYRRCGFQETGRTPGGPVTLELVQLRHPGLQAVP